MLEQTLEFISNLLSEEKIALGALIVSIATFFYARKQTKAAQRQADSAEKSANAAVEQLKILEEQEQERKEDQLKAKLVVHFRQVNKTTLELKIKNEGMADARNVRLYFDDNDLPPRSTKIFKDISSKNPIKVINRFKPRVYSIPALNEMFRRTYDIKIKWDDDCQKDNEEVQTIP